MKIAKSNTRGGNKNWLSKPTKTRIRPRVYMLEPPGMVHAFGIPSSPINQNKLKKKNLKKITTPKREEKKKKEN